MEAPWGNCHLRGWAGSSDRPYPDKSMAALPPLYNSTQSGEDLLAFWARAEATASLRMSPEALSARSWASTWLSPA